MNRCEYVPARLRGHAKLKLEVKYAIGIEKEPDNIALTFGPVADEIIALNEMGEDNAVILRFNEDGTDQVLWRWKEDRWVEEV